MSSGFWSNTSSISFINFWVIVRKGSSVSIETSSEVCFVVREVNKAFHSTLKLSNVLWAKFETRGESGGESIRRRDKDELGTPRDESALEFDLYGVSVEQTEEKRKLDVFAPEVIEDDHGLSIIAIEPSERSRTEPHVVWIPSELVTNLPCCPGFTGAGGTIDPEYTWGGGDITYGSAKGSVSG